jgi:hypothetical protein
MLAMRVDEHWFLPSLLSGERVWVRRMAEWEPIDRAAVKVMVQGVRGRLGEDDGSRE